MEQDQYLSYFPPSSRFNNVVVTAKETGADVLTRDNLVEAMKMHQSIEMGQSDQENKLNTFTDLCSPAGGSCATANFTDPVCTCLVVSVLKMWNYDLAKLEADTNIIGTLNAYGSREDLEGVLGAPVFDPTTGNLESAEAISVSYFLEDRSSVESGSTIDLVNEAWEEQVFLKTVQDADQFPSLDLYYLSSRSFGGKVVMLRIRSVT